jgi:5-methylcytosine-specific restriction protein A
MTTSAKHACRAAGCPALVADGHTYCPTHAADIGYRGAPSARGYTKRWYRRARRFRDQFPLCGMRPNSQPPVMSQCYEENRVTAADHVDHVVPHRGNQVLMWDELHNWQSLCASCHARKTAAGL